MPPRQSRRRKAEAVVLADALNSSEEAGKQLGIPGRSIRRWRDDPDLADIVQKTREETADDVKVAMVLAWELIIERLKAGAIETKDLIVLGGVSFDKHQLATGGATARTEARELNDLPDVAYIDAVREAKRLTESPNSDGALAEDRPD